MLDLFLDVLVEESDETLVEFAMGGICNCCLDKLNKEFLLSNDAVLMVAQHLSSSNEETVLSAIATLMDLTTPETKKGSQNALGFCIHYCSSFDQVR